MCLRIRDQPVMHVRRQPNFGSSMAHGTDHIVGGVAVGLFSAYLLRSYIPSLSIFSLCLLCAVAGSLFPDIDIKSKGQKFFYGIMAPAYIFLFARGQLVLCFVVGLCALLPVMSSHRGLFHRWWFILAFASLWGIAVARMFPHYADQAALGTIFFMLGSLSHLWLDFGPIKMFTR